jgi:hypothetical protein
MEMLVSLRSIHYTEQRYSDEEVMIAYYWYRRTHVRGCPGRIH